MGLGPDLLPGCCLITDDAARAKFEKVWVRYSERNGLSAAEILAKAESGEIRGLYIVGENPLDTYPIGIKWKGLSRSSNSWLCKTCFETSTAKMAHAVLPVYVFHRKDRDFHEFQSVDPAGQTCPESPWGEVEPGSLHCVGCHDGQTGIDVLRS